MGMLPPYRPFAWILLAAAVCFAVSYLLFATGLNSSWMLAIHTDPYLPNWFWALVNLGGDGWIVLLFLLLLESKPGQFTSWILKTWLVGACLVQIIKRLFPMPRPASVIGIENLSLVDHPPLFSGSMPSGHALAAISCALIACLILRARGVSRWVIVSICSLAGLAGWARVAVGAHWPSDVFAGAGLAIVVVLFAYQWERFHSWNIWFTTKNGHRFLIFLNLAIALHLMFPQSDFSLIQFLQLSLACISLYKAFALTKHSSLTQ